MSDFNYHADLEIDRDSLDTEFLRQPGMYFRYSEALTQAEADRDHAKERLDVLWAQLDAAVRKNPARYGLDKVVEAAVNNAIVLQSVYQKAKQAYIELVKRASLLTAAVRAMVQRKDSLEGLARLAVAGYFAAPRAASAEQGVSMVESAREETRETIRQAFRRGK
jgi:creatinine amidohydrolase/Fe(II)-dependent formamide hydrolase-like protein